MDEKKIARINELAKKSREEDLSTDELAEQKRLREEYIASFRNNLKATLDNTYIVDDEGNKKKLGEK